MKKILFLIIILSLSCENPFYKKKNRLLSKDAGDTAYFYGVVLGCFNWKAPDFCSQSNSVSLIRLEDTKCGLRVVSSSPYIYNESGTQILTDSITGVQKLQCKWLSGSHIQPGTYRWYKVDDAVPTKAILVFTHTQVNSQNVNDFTAYNVGDTLLCCREDYIDQPSCKEPYWDIECNKLKIQ